jgi:hypothetical protein
MKIIKYLYPLYESIGAGPDTSEWTNTKGSLLLQLDNLKYNLVCLPKLHTSPIIVTPQNNKNSLGVINPAMNAWWDTRT